MSEKFVAWNGSIQPADSIQINSTAESWLYGYGCFETMGWENGEIRFLEDHWSRLLSTSSAMGLEVSFSKDDLQENAESLGGRNQCEVGLTRLSLHLDGNETNWMLRVFGRKKRIDDSPMKVGFSRFPHPGASPLSIWKHNNYLLNLMAFRESQAEGLDEAVLCRDDEIVEGSRSNIWALWDGELITPSLESGALPGVIRKRILQGAESVGIPVREAKLRVVDLPEVEGLFLSNAAMIFRPVASLGSLAFAPNPDWKDWVKRAIRT
jgi:branched-subunit amino acid aminotransferase/4-amino-4-deoxychorismate lyase